MNLYARMNPELAKVFEFLPSLGLDDIPNARSTLVQILTTANQGVPPNKNVIREDHLIPGLNQSPDIKVRYYRPSNQTGPLPCLYWIHGGGYVLGSIDQDDLIMDHIVETVGCATVSVEWRRAPEHPFPASINDCYAGLIWTYNNATDLGIDPKRIAVGGASSGGGSAAGLALLARDKGEIPVCFQLLIYPMIDDRNVTPSSYAITDPRLWSRQWNLIAWRSYVGDVVGTDDVSPYAAAARAVNLDGLPPAYISVGDLDLFLDEDIVYAQRLLQAGVPTELHIYAGAPHGFDQLAPRATLSQRFARDRDEALRRAFQA